jgi:hypothetical protein
LAVGRYGYGHWFDPYQTIMTSKSRSWLERDHSKVGSSGQSLHHLATRSLPVLQVSVLYDNARSAIRNAVTPIWGVLPSVSEWCVISVPVPISENFSKEWTVHIEVKCLHFSAASQYRKSIDDTEHNKSASWSYASVSRLTPNPLGMAMKWRAWPSHSLRRKALSTRHVEGRPSQSWKMSRHVIMSLSNYLSDTPRTVPSGDP